MDEKAVFCLAASFLGIAALFSQAASAEPLKVFPEQLSPSDAGSLVLLSGRISSVRQSNGSVFLIVCRSSCVGVAVFSPLASQMQGKPFDPRRARPGASVSVEGIVEEDGRGIFIVPLGVSSIEYS